MTPAEMRDKLMKLGYSAIYAVQALKMTNCNFEEAKELLCLYTKSSMQLTYELLKLRRRVEELERTNNDKR
jgi:hypothetical protein